MSELLKKYESLDQSKLNEGTIKILNRVKTITADFTADDAKNNKIAEDVLNEVMKKNPNAVKIVKRTPKAKTATKKTHKATHTTKGAHTTSSTPKSSNNIMSVAKEIQKSGESWKDAMERAKVVLKERKEQVVQKQKTELEKLYNLVKTKKELQGFTKSDIQRDAKRDAKPRGARVVTKQGSTSNKYGTFPNKLGRKYWETRDRHADRLAPNYPKGMPLLASGGAVSDAPFSVEVFKTKLRFDNELTSSSKGDLPTFAKAKEFAIDMIDNGNYYAYIISKNGYLWGVDSKGVEQFADGGMMDNMSIHNSTDFFNIPVYANGGSVNMDKHVWEGWTVGDFIEELEPTFNQIMSGRSWQKPFKTKDEVKAWAMDNQPYYKKNIPEVVNYFWAKAQSKDNYANGGGIDGGMNNLTIQNVSFAKGGSIKEVNKISDFMKYLSSISNDSAKTSNRDVNKISEFMKFLSSMSNENKELKSLTLKIQDDLRGLIKSLNSKEKISKEEISSIQEDLRDVIKSTESGSFANGGILNFNDFDVENSESNSFAGNVLVKTEISDEKYDDIIDYLDSAGLEPNPFMGEEGTHFGFRFNGSAEDLMEILENFSKYLKSHKIKAEIDELNESDESFANGGSVSNERMYNFLKDDLAELEEAIKSGDFEEVNRFFSYWLGSSGHLKSLETKTNERMYNFLKEDLEKLEVAVENNDTEEVERFFSYWGQHLESLKMAKGGNLKSEFTDLKEPPVGYDLFTYFYSTDEKSGKIVWNIVGAYNDVENGNKARKWLDRQAEQSGFVTLKDGTEIKISGRGSATKSGLTRDVELNKGIIRVWEEFKPKYWNDETSDDYANGGSLPFMTDPNFGNFQNTGAFANGGSIGDLTEQEFLKKYFGASVFTENPSQYFEIKKLSSSDDAKVNAFVKELKADGFTVKKRAFSDFTSVMGVKKKASFELGGAFMMTDLAGHTGGSDGLGNPMPLSGVSGTYYTGLVGETGAMSSGELFMDGGAMAQNQQVINDASQSYVNYYLGEGASQGIYKDGGSIPNNYEGRTPEDVWNNWTVSQKEHFVSDHFEVFSLTIPEFSDWFKKYGEFAKNNASYDTLPPRLKSFLKDHISEGQYAKGGAIKNQYKDRTDKDIWNSFSIAQRQHFLKDHFEDIQTVATNSGVNNINHFGNLIGWANRDYEDLPTYIKSPFNYHTESGQYASGGSLGKALYVANSSYFDYNKYDEEKIMSALKSIGAKNIHLEKDGGMFNQPEVVVFNGSKRQAEDALNEAFDTDYILIYEKDWRTKKMADGGFTPDVSDGTQFMSGVYANGGSVGDVSGNYYSTTDFVSQNDLMDLAKSTFGQDWESGGDYDYDTEEIKMLVKKLGGGYKIVYVDSEEREKFENAKSKYLPLLKNKSNDGDIFVIPNKKMSDGGFTPDVSDGTQFMSGVYANGGSVGDDFEEVIDLGAEQYYTRRFGEVGTDSRGDVELVVVATIRDLEDYMSEDELPEDGNFELNITLVPTEEFISEEMLESANDEDSSISDDSVVNLVNYAGGLNYNPQSRMYFESQQDALDYLMSKELKDKINTDAMLAGFVMDRQYNRAGQDNWGYLDYLMGVSDRFAKGGALNKDNVKVGDVLMTTTGVKVKVTEFDPLFGGRVRAIRLDKYGNGKESQFMSLSKFTDKVEVKKTKKQLREEYLDNVADETSEVWDKIGASSGGQIREDQKLLKAYADGTEEVMQKMGVKKGSFNRADYDYYTDNNAHLFNDFLVFNDYYNSSVTKEEKEWRIKAYDEDIKKNGKSLYNANPDVITVIGKTSSSSKPKKYIDHDDIESVTLNVNGNFITFAGKDFLNGANLMEKGGDLSKIATYFPIRDIVKVTLKNGDTIKPLNGYWLKKGSEPMGKKNTTNSPKTPTQTNKTSLRTLVKKFETEKPSVALGVISTDVVEDFMREKFDKTIDWEKLSSKEKEDYNKEYEIKRDNFRNYLDKEFLNNYYSDENLRKKLSGQSRKTIDSIKAEYVKIAKTYDYEKYADGGFMSDVYAKGGEISIYNLRKGDKVKTRKGDIETIVKRTGSGSYETIENEYTHSPESLEFVSRPSRKMSDGGSMSEDISECKKLVSAFCKEFGDKFGLDEEAILEKVKFQDYLGHGASVFISLSITSNVTDLKVGETRPTIGYIILGSDINPNGVTGKDDIARTYDIDIEIKGIKRYTQRRTEEGRYFKSYSYGRTIEEAMDKTDTKILYDLYPLEKKDDLKFKMSHLFANGGGFANDPFYKAFMEKRDKLYAQLKSRVVRAVGIDEAMDFFDYEHSSIAPYRFLERAVQSNLIALDEINKELVDSAIEESREIDNDEDLEEIGSSDFTYYLKSVLDNAGFKVGFVNDRLQRLNEDGSVKEIENNFADGGFMNDVYAKGGELQGKFLAEIKVPYNYESVVKDEFEFTEFLSKALTKKWFGNGVWGVKIVKSLFGENYGQKIVVEIEIPVGVTQGGGLDKFDVGEFISKTLTKKWFGNGIWGVDVVKSFADGGMFEDNDGFMRADNNNNYRYPEMEVYVETLDEPIDLTSNVSSRSNKVVIKPLDENIDLNDDNRVRATMGYNPKNRNPENFSKINPRAFEFIDLPMPTSNTHKND